MLRQIAAVTIMNLRNVPQRLGGSAVIVIGMVCSVAVIVSIAATAVGVNQVVFRTGHVDRAIVLSKGARGEGDTNLPRGSDATILSAPFIKTAQDGKPLASAEVVSWTMVKKRADGLDQFISVRGIDAGGHRLRIEVKLTGGRMFTSAVRELIVGRTAQLTYAGVEIGDEVKVQNSVWTIVGTFESNGDIKESGFMGDSDTLMSAIRRNGWSSILMQLETPDRLAAVKDFLTGNPSVTVDVKRETDYFRDAAKPLNSFLLLVTTSVGVILGLGAFAGALNTMYSTVRARTVEIATLRAIGFGVSSVITSVLAESMLLAGLGATIGASIAWLLFDGNKHSAWGYVYASAVTPQLMLSAIGGALLVGLIGGVIPAVRAARLPIAKALWAR